MVLRNSIKMCLSLLGIFFICSLPYLFFDIDKQLKILMMIDRHEIRNTLFMHDSIEVRWSSYLVHVMEAVKQFFMFDNPLYYNHGKYLPLFPELFVLFERSFLMLITSLSLGIVASIFFTFLIMKMRMTGRKVSQYVLFIFESLPDLFIILLIQYLIIVIYKKTGILFFNTADSYNDPAFMLPVICLSILPTVFLTKQLLYSFQEEEKQLYVELALGKGMSRSYVLLVHILRNAFVSLFRHFKTLFWFSLSNLFVMEILFNIRGIMKFVIKFSPMTPNITVYVLLLFLLPYILFLVVFNLIFRKLGFKGVNGHA